VNNHPKRAFEAGAQQAIKEAREGWKVRDPKAGKCLMAALADVTRHRDRKLVKGPAGNPWDTAHFWTEDSKGKVYDRTADLVPPGYAYKGRTVNPESVRKELEKEHLLSKTSEVQPLLRHRSTLLIRDPETNKLLAAKNRNDPRFDDASPYYFPGGGLYDDEYDTPRTPTEEEILEGARREALEELGFGLTNPRVVGGSTNLMPKKWLSKVLKRRGVPYEGGHEHLVLADKGDVDNSLYNVEGDAFTEGKYFDPQEVYNSLVEYGNSEGQFAPYNRSQARAIKEYLLAAPHNLGKRP